MNSNINAFIFKDISTLKGVGKKLKKYLKKKYIEKVKDLLLDLPYSITDRSKITNLTNLEIGKIANISVEVIKYNFPRVRNLPNKVVCSDGKNKINIIFFNSNEFYIRKVLPIQKKVLVSGKISYYNKNYQITNPTYIKPFDRKSELLQIFPKYTLTEGITEKTYRNLVHKTLSKIKGNEDWHDKIFLKKNGFNDIKKTLDNLHNPKNPIDINSNDYRRLAFDEIFSNFLMLLKARKTVKTNKIEPKKFFSNIENKILKRFPYKLTDGQRKILEQLDRDVSSSSRMFRLIQGDVGSGKTILALILAGKICSCKYQVAYMAPTDVLAKQQYIQAKNLFQNTGLEVALLTSKIKNKKDVINKLTSGKIDIIVGTHALFQKKINFKKLGLIIIDEQHKFGVRQRIALAKKGGKNCDVLLMSATPIPRSMMMSIYGDMDISKLTEKPLNRKEILTLIKPEKKINEIYPLLKKQISLNSQIYWVCPLIEESKKINYSSVINKFNIIKKIFPKQVDIIHGNLDENEKNLAIDRFKNKEINILVSTTVIEVGVDVPSANTIIIENADKFGLSQLHQLRGRVGRGNNESLCILLYKENLSENAKKRLKILKSTNDGFKIAEEDLKLRGHGDILGYQQSGIKNFKFADPIHHKDLFFLAENEIKTKFINFNNYINLLKLYDKAEIVTDVE